ncbi:MAG: DUF2182 domain-containing protein, partial [Mesorhizobium sp.]
MSGEQHDFSHLDRAGRATAGVARSPRFAVTLTVGVAIVLACRPGDMLLKNLPSLPLPDFLDRFFALCLAPAQLAGPAGLQAPAVALMWFLMAVATMLPSAAPLIRTFCEIADTARIKG